MTDDPRPVFFDQDDPGSVRVAEIDLRDRPSGDGGPAGERPDGSPEVVVDEGPDVPTEHWPVETQAMDLVELAVEVTAPNDAEPDDVVPRRSIDIALDPPQFADDPDADPVDAPGDADAPAAGSVPEPTEPSESSGPGVDPRIEARREDVATAGRRRRWRWALAVVAALVVGAGAVGVLNSPALDVDHIDIVGSEQLTLAQLRARTGLGLGSPLAFVDPHRVEARLRTDPRFVRVVVIRRFPSTVSIRLTDRRAIAVVVGPRRGLVVGEDGVVIAKARGDELLRHVEVRDDPTTEVGGRLPAPLAAAVDVMGSMSFEIAVQIQRMSITPEGELVFDLGDGRTALFGAVDDAERKLLAIKTMLGPQVDLRDVCELDVRVPTAPTMRRNPDCDPPPPPPDPAVVDPAVAPPAATDPAAPTTVPTTVGAGADAAVQD